MRMGRPPLVRRFIHLPVGIHKILLMHFDHSREKRKLIEFDRAVKATRFFYDKTRYYEHDPKSYIPLDRTLKERLLNSRFRHIWPKLVKLKILQEWKYLHTDRSEYGFSTKMGICKHYRIKPDLLHDPTVETEYYDTLRSGQSSHSISPLSEREAFLAEKTKEFLKHLRFRSPHSTESVCHQIRQRKNLLINHRYLPRITQANGAFWFKGKKIAFHAQSLQECAEKLANRYIDISIEKLRDLEERVFRATRNDTNRRLDHNLTNLNQEIIKNLAFSSKKAQTDRECSLISIDLRNAQFTILAHLIAKESRGIEIAEEEIAKPIGYIVWYKNEFVPDLDDFFADCACGRLYDKLAERLGIERAQAKIFMFKILFGHYKHNKSEKVQLTKAYPDLVKFIDGYKEGLFSLLRQEHSADPQAFRKRYQTKRVSQPRPIDEANNRLSKLLQNIEAIVFVDRILFRLLREGYSVLSKHDSIICLSKDRHAVEGIVREELTRFFGSSDYTLAVEELSNQ